MTTALSVVIPGYSERSGDPLPQQFRLGDNITKHRKRTGLTQDALGAMLGVSAQAVSKWERQIAYPDITLLPTIADLFGITLDELFSDTSDGPCYKESE